MTSYRFTWQSRLSGNGLLKLGFECLFDDNVWVRFVIVISSHVTKDTIFKDSSYQPAIVAAVIGCRSYRFVLLEEKAIDDRCIFASSCLYPLHVMRRHLNGYWTSIQRRSAKPLYVLQSRAAALQVFGKAPFGKSVFRKQCYSEKLTFGQPHSYQVPNTSSTNSPLTPALSAATASARRKTNEINCSVIRKWNIR